MRGQIRQERAYGTSWPAALLALHALLPCCRLVGSDGGTPASGQSSCRPPPARRLQTATPSSHSTAISFFLFISSTGTRTNMSASISSEQYESLIQASLDGLSTLPVRPTPTSPPDRYLLLPRRSPRGLLLAILTLPCRSSASAALGRDYQGCQH